jgi:hypothetical protein
MTTLPRENPFTTSQTNDRVGFYCWGGPGTIRMIEVKYFNPAIDIDSHMTCYDYDYVARVQELFGVTDFWVSYSWGFSDETEAGDRRFIIDRLDNFKRLGIRVHAYIQGPNLVFDEFRDKDWWARDEKDRTITYYRGRWQCSIHAQEYRDYVLGKIEDLHGVGFDGIFVDNIQHGQLGVPMPRGETPFVFTGDRSSFARRAFYAEHSADIPDDLERDPELTDTYLNFRIKSNTEYVALLSDAAHRGNMEFGTNFYDPKFDPTHVYAIDLEAMVAHQDYVLFENHALPESDGSRHNEYIEEIVAERNWNKPAFLVSYREGVGMAPQFSQEDLDNLFSEAVQANFSLCLKGSEFTTNGVWHCMYLDDYASPERNKPLPRLPLSAEPDVIYPLLKIRLLRTLAKRYYNPIFRTVFEWRIFRDILNVVYDRVLK